MTTRTQIVLISVIALMAGLGVAASDIAIKLAQENVSLRKQAEAIKDGSMRSEAEKILEATSTDPFVLASYQRLKGSFQGLYKIDDNRYWIGLIHGYLGGPSYSLWLINKSLDHFEPEHFIHAFTGGQCGDFQWVADSEGVTVIEMTSPCEAFVSSTYYRYDNNGKLIGTMNPSVMSADFSFQMKNQPEVAVELVMEGFCDTATSTVLFHGVNVNKKFIRLSKTRKLQCQPEYGDTFASPGISHLQWQGSGISADLPGGGSIEIDPQKGETSAKIIER
jgi:hypothetical protein